MEKGHSLRGNAPCNDCGKDTEPDFGEWDSYLLRNETWLSAGIGPDGFLCTPCLAKRLGRIPLPEEFVARVIDRDGRKYIETTEDFVYRVLVSPDTLNSTLYGARAPRRAEAG